MSMDILVSLMILGTAILFAGISAHAARRRDDDDKPR